MQNHYNLVYREEEREMMPMLKVICHSLRIHFDSKLSHLALWCWLYPLVSAW